MRSPFKFLDSYRQEDAREFFGRDDEKDLLYDFVNKNRLVVVYGTSGTGKTSLVQCGLASRFDATDWFPLFVRRGQNSNVSLREALLKNDPTPDASSRVSEIVTRLNSRFLRPVYLIFDQLEELLILGKEEEQIEFIETIKELLHAPDLDCHILFILREEFLARLYAFEREIPTLFDRRLRVEPMSHDKLDKVIRGSCARFNIVLESPAENAGQIIASLSSGKSGISLPYLQVYLDMLWREDYQRTYPTSSGDELEAKLSRKEYPKLEFSSDEILTFGQIEDVLARFLSQQTAWIKEQLLISQPQAPPETVRQVLDCFVTAEGTKQPVPYSTHSEALQMDARAPEYLKKLPTAVATTVLRLLERSRILRFTEDTIELAHDALAALIDQQRSDAERRLNELYNRLQNNYREYRDNKDLLTRKQLTVLEEFLPLLKPRLDQPVLDFIAASYADANTKEQAAWVAERKKRSRFRLVALFTTALSVISIAAFIRMNHSYAEAAKANQKAQEELTKRERLEITKYIQQGKNFENSGDFDLALIFYGYVRDSLFSKKTHRGHPQKKDLDQRILQCRDSLQQARGL